MERKKITFQDIFKLEDKKVKIKFNTRNDTEFTDGSTSAHELLTAYCEDEYSKLADRWLEMLEWREPSNHNHNLDDCDYLLAFAQYPQYGTNCYIFGGLYKISFSNEKIGKDYKGRGYKLKREDSYSEYINRLVLKFEKSIGRTYTRTYKNIMEMEKKPEILAILPLNEGIGPFVGYNETYLTHAQLQKIANADAPDWRQALSNIKAVYCITDTSNGKLYIGSANSQNSIYTMKKGSDQTETLKGLWGRWRYYANENDLTGGNEYFNDIVNGRDESIKKEIAEDGREHIKKYFTYAILEIFDIRTADSVVLARESFWKKVFQSRKFGMNRN